ncbi:hypothetical protein [Paenibacillus sp. ISL-20]|uniref:hypothetical protein n=1 Tax=Paenibacillus sp. ISL-20 TaxID=2819163 RepID=UPI001BEBA5E5|nr:hypothetical protein [Paenibacillus sp. ISL-20]MBT2762409.1 hypothetical protein [Paenibacillus sp. ISL-20]
MNRGSDLYKNSYSIEDAFSHGDFKELEKIREKFNGAFRKNGIDIFVDKDFTLNRLSAYEDLNYEYDQLDRKTIEKLNSDLLINNFFFFPSHKLVFMNDTKGQTKGMRICFIKQGKRRLKVHVFDITNKQYQTIGKWMTEQYFGKKLKFNESFREMYQSYIRIFKKYAEELDAKSAIVYTTQSGWIQGGHKWFYVPVSPVDEYDLLYDMSLQLKYKMSALNQWTLDDAFQKTWSLLNIADKRVTLPLLSYTFLSLITSLIGYNEDRLPKFTVCISGNNKVLGRQGFANLFCNLYARKSNIFTLNSIYHLKSNIDKKMLEKKSSKIRDGIFIINADKRPKIIDRAMQGLQNYSVENMVLMLNEKQLDREFVLNLNISDLAVSSDQVESLRKLPDSLSACIFYVTEKIREVHDISNKKKIEKYFHKRYKHFRQLLESDNLAQEEDKVHMYSCLLIGLELLLTVVKNDLVVYDERVWDDEVQAYMNEAVQLFQHECVIQPEVKDTREKWSALAEENSELLKEEHVIFLEKLLELLPTSLPRYEDKNDNPEVFVWMSEDDENILSVENVIFRTILFSLDEKFGSLSGKEQKSNITKYKNRIYKKLRSEEIRIILPKNEEPENRIKVNIGTTEKDDYTGNRSAATRRDIKVFRIHWGKALAYLASFQH